MQHARNRAARAGAHIRRGARDRAGDADAAEHAAGHIRDPLSDQFAIRAMPAAGHAVGDDGGEQDSIAPSSAKRNRRRQHRPHLRQRDRR